MTIDEAMQVALQHYQAGRLAEAEKIYRQILAKFPDHAGALHLLGVLAGQVGRRDVAVELISRAIAIDPTLSEMHSNLGNILKQMGRFDEAIAAQSRAIQLTPNCAEAHNNLGNALRNKGRLDEAIAAYGRAIQLRPELAEAHNNLGNALADAGRLDETIGSYRRAIELKPDLAEAHSNLGNALKDVGRHNEAIAAHNRAIQLKPDDAGSHYNLGVVLKDMGRLDAAIASYNRAIQLKPDYAEAQMNLAMVRLILGDFQRGWREYESRWQVKALSLSRRPFSQPRWDGGDLRGQTILLYAEQGFGDAIQFVRYAPLVASRGGRVVLECRRPLVRLFENIEPISQVIRDDEPPPRFDVQCPLASLPLAMKTDCVESIPANVPYLRPPDEALAMWEERLRPDSSKFKIGLTWAGGPKPPGRSISLAALDPLAAIPGVQFYSLQTGPAAQQAHDPPAGMKLIDCSAHLHDFADTAGLIANLDLVITVDTAVAHLAGAMARPVWTLVKFSPDWRWLLDRDDSPWYPTMRLFRQPAIGDWATVIQGIAEQLRRHVMQHSSHG